MNSIGLRLMLSVVSLPLFAGSLCGAERRLLEPETFAVEGRPLLRHPFFQEQAPHWYALETSCRAQGGPGRGQSAVIHEGATNRILVARLDPPLAAGTYQIMFSSSGMIWQDQPTVVRVGLGGSNTDVSWRKGSNKIQWMPAGRITIDKPAETMSLEAVQWGGKGFGLLYEINSRCILIDQIYLTSDLTEKTGPTSAGAHVVHGDRAAPADAIAEPGTGYREVTGLPTPAMRGEALCYPISLAAVSGRINLLPNSSFELGGGDGWSSANASRSGNVHIFSEADHVRDAFHGEYALRLPGKGVGGMQFSRAFDLPAGGLHTFSGYVKALAGAAKPVTVRITPIGARNQFEESDAKLALKRPVLQAVVTPGTEWQRFVVTGPLEAGPCVLAVNGACLLDAVQLEKGETGTPFMPRAAVEASLSTDQLGHIQYADRPTELTAWAHNAGADAADAALKYRIVDVREQVLEEKTVSFSVPPGQTLSQRVVIGPTRRGLFNVVYAAAGRPYAEGELVYAVLPPIPEGMPRHALGSNMDNDPASFDLMKRMGHKWQLYCKLYADKPSQLNPKPDDYQWEALRKVLELPRQNGLQVMPALWPSQLPAHLQDASLCEWAAYGDGRRDVARQIKNQAGKPADQRTAVLYPDLKAWREHCKRLAEAVGDIQPWWTVEDESELYFTAREFARIVRATAEGFRDSGKPMKISLSCMPDYLDELIAEWGGEMPLSGVGASSYDYEYWEARKARLFQQRWNVPWFCIGVGAAGEPQFRRTGPFGKPVYAHAVRTAQHMLMLTLVQDAKVLGHYTGRLWFQNSLAHGDYPLMDYDGTPLPHGFGFSCLPLLLAEAVPVEDVYLESMRTLVFVFRQNGRLHAATWSTAVTGEDIHWPAEPRIWRDLRLKGAAGKVTVADMYGNAREDVRKENGDNIFDLTEEPALLFNEGLSDEAFLAMIRGITAAPRPVDLGLAFIPNGKGGVDLGVRAVNNTTNTLADMELDANFPPNRMLTRVDWTLPDRNGKIGTLAPGQTNWGRLGTTIDLKTPVENATYTVWLTDAGGREHVGYDTCWMTVAPRLRPTIDGALDEWSGVPAAWMYYTFSWGRLGRHNVQFVNGGEHFKYVKRVDARASIRASHDDQKLYLAIRCEDDDLIRKATDSQADRLEIKLRSAPGEGDGVRTLVLEPTGQGVSLSGSAAEGAAAAMTVAEARNEHAPYTIWNVEVAIPLSALGGPKQPGDAIGFDVVWHDADHDGKEVVTGTWRWAGRSTGLGSLFFQR
jgi:hypothetical protein